MSKFISYNRVSTAEQGKSGLGLDSQEAACRAYAAAQGGEVIKCFTEVESGKRNDRPELAKAFRHADLTKATVVFAKLDRLSRDAAFLLNLKASGVRFIALDCPKLETLDLGMRAIFAQHEREVISARTKAALALVKAKGEKRMGNPNGAKAFGDSVIAGRETGRKVRTANALAFAERYRAVIAENEAKGITTLAGIAASLNAEGLKPVRGGQWDATGIKRLRARLGL